MRLHAITIAVALSVLVDDAAQAQKTTTIAFDDTHVYQGTTTGLYVRSLLDPSQVTWLQRSDRLQRLLQKQLADPGDRLLNDSVRRRERAVEKAIPSDAENHVLAGNHVVGVVVDATQRLWVASDNGIVRREADGRWQSITIPLRDVPLCGLALAGKDVWALHCSGGVARYQNGTWIGHGAFEGNIGYAHTLRVSVAADGTLTIPLYGGGVATYSDGAWKTRRFGGERDWVHAAIVDREGTIWGALDRGNEAYGLLRADKNHATTELAHQRVLSLAAIDGGVVVGMEKGAIIIRGKSMTQLSPALAGARIDALAEHDGVWVGTEGTLWRVRGEKAEHFPTTIPHLDRQNVKLMIVMHGGLGSNASAQIEVAHNGAACALYLSGTFVGLPKMPRPASCASVDALFDQLNLDTLPLVDPNNDDGGSMHTSWVHIFVRTQSGGGWKDIGATGGYLTDDMPQRAAYDAAFSFIEKAIGPIKWQTGF
jgi:hypothetical protein